jgi:hypothetical protein
LADITGMPGSESLAGTSADDSISALGGDDVIHGGGDDLLGGGRGLDNADPDDPIRISKLSTIPAADFKHPRRSAGPDRVHRAHPCRQMNKAGREPRSRVPGFNLCNHQPKNQLRRACPE